MAPLTVTVQFRFCPVSVAAVVQYSSIIQVFIRSCVNIKLMLAYHPIIPARVSRSDIMWLTAGFPHSPSRCAWAAERGWTGRHTRSGYTPPSARAASPSELTVCPPPSPLTMTPWPPCWTSPETPRTVPGWWVCAGVAGSDAASLSETTTEHQQQSEDLIYVNAELHTVLNRT